VSGQRRAARGSVLTCPPPCAARCRWFSVTLAHARASPRRYALGYLAVFGVLGYAFTFWRLKGGRPEEYECKLLAHGLRLAALVLIYHSTQSLRASVSLQLGALLLRSGSLGIPVRHLVRLLWRDRGPADAPTTYVADDGHARAWRPATASGQYMTEAEYSASGEAETSSALSQLFSSPEYHRWLMTNHHRIALAEDDTLREPILDDDSD
jgi:hypothetical protein